MASDGTTLTGSNVTLVGTGTVNLPAANSFGAGATTLGGATLNVGTASAIGTGTVTLVSGTLTATTSSVKLSNALAFNNSTVTFAGANPLIFSGNATLGGTNNTVTVSNTGLTILNGAMSTLAGAVGNLTKAGTGTLVLSGSNTYTGQTVVTAGAVQVQNNTALGAAGGGAAVVTASGASIQVLGTGLVIGKTLIVNGTGVINGALENLFGGSNVWSGNVFMNSASTIAADGGTTLSITGVVSGPGDLTTAGIGTVVLASANAYTGNTTVANGILSVQNGLGLGLPTGVGGTATVAAGATLQVQGGITVSGKNVTLAGTGFGNAGSLPQGALVSQSGANTWAGTITLTGTVALTADPIPTLKSTSTGTLIGAANGSTLFVAGVVAGTDLTKVGPGAVTLLNIDTYTGATSVLGGTLTLANTNDSAVGATTISGAVVNGAFTAGNMVLNNFGTTASSAITIDQGGSLTLDNTAVNIAGTSTLGTGRLTNSSAKPNLTFNAGSFSFIANNTPGAASSENVGSITLATGQSTITTGYAAAAASGATSVVIAASLVETASSGATVNFFGGTGNVTPLGTSTNMLLFTTAPTTVGTGGGILPYAEVNGGAGTGDFATYTAGTGVAAYTNYVTTLATAGVNDIVKLTAAATLSGNQTVGAILSPAARSRSPSTRA